MTRTRDQRRATAFTVNARMERLLALRRFDGGAFDRLGSQERLTVAFSEAAKAAAAREQERAGGAASFSTFSTPAGDDRC